MSTKMVSINIFLLKDMVSPLPNMELGSVVAKKIEFNAPTPISPLFSEEKKYPFRALIRPFFAAIYAEETKLGVKNRVFLFLS